MTSVRDTLLSLPLWLRVDPRRGIYAFSAILILLAWVLAGWRISAERDLELGGLRKESSNLVRAYEEQVVRSLQAIDQTLLFLKSEYEQRGTALDFSRYIREGRVMQGIAHLLMVIDADGQVVLATSPLQALDVARHEYEYMGDHASTRHSDLLIGRPVFGRVSSQWRLPVSRRLEDADGRYAGVVVASIDPAYFSAFYRQVDIGRFAAVELVGRDGIVRARQSSDSSTVGQDLTDTPLLLQATNQLGGSFEAASAIDGKARMHGFRVLGEYGLIAAVGIALDEGLADSRSRAAGYLWGATGFSLFIMVFGYALIASLRRTQAAYQELHQSQRSLAEAQRIAQIGDWELDLETQHGRFSPETARILGLPEDAQELGLVESLQLAVPEDRDLVKELVERAASRGQQAKAQWRIRRGGELRWLAATAEPFRLPSGRPALRGTLMDITASKRQEESAERERQILQQIAGGAPRQGVFAELCAYLEQQCPGARCALLLLDASRLQVLVAAAPGLPAEFCNALAKLPPPESAAACVSATAGGARVIVEDMWADGSGAGAHELCRRFGLRACTATPIVSGTGETKGSFALYWPDVHVPTEAETEAVQKTAYLASIYLDREEREAQIYLLNAELEERVTARTAELQSVNRELEAFSYSVSHDLRAPLRAIDGFSAILLHSHADQLDEPSRNLLSRIVAAAQRMGRLIDDMLALARVNRSPLHFEDIDLAVIARAIVEDLTQPEDQRKVDWVIPTSLPERADPALIRVVLENLLGNAWKFTRNRVEARIEFSATLLEGERVYCVRDNGVGFDMVYADKLFGPFQRLHRPEEFPGTGIGLATVQRLIHRHHGRIWAESRPGQGAAFFFTLDAASASVHLKRVINA